MKTQKKSVLSKIKIREITDSYEALGKTGSYIRKHLPQEIIFHPNEYIIAYHCLTLFDIRYDKYSPTDNSSIEIQCDFLLHKFGVYVDRKNMMYDKNEDGYQPVHHFVKYIAGFQQLPKKLLDELQWKVKGDLKKLLALIVEYDADSIIKELKKGNRRPEHKSKVIIEFYERCIEERQVITEYLINRLEDRAIEKAIRDPDLHTGIAFAWYDSYRDRPYKWALPRSIEYFDYRKINVCRHRLDMIAVPDIQSMEKLYHSNKNAFYNKLKKVNPPARIFQQLTDYYIPLLPKLNARKPIFTELSSLLKSRKWYAFTALALTQVEGIFSDMLFVINPKGNYSSLSTKVFAIRPHSNSTGNSLDYFEYSLPFLRNGFLHSGSIQGRNFKLLSYDLLYDLLFLVTVYKGLKDAHIELNNLLQQDNTRIIFGLKDFNHIFSLLREIHDRQKKHSVDVERQKTLDLWDAYKQTILIPSAEMEYWANDVNNVIDKNIIDFFTEIKMHTENQGKEIDLMTESVGQVKKKIPDIKELFFHLSYSLREDYERLIDVYHFLHSYKNYIPECPKDAVNVFSNIYERNQDSFKKLSFLEEVIS